MSEEEFCEKCENYNKHIAQPNNLPSRNTFYVGIVCPRCYPSKPIGKVVLDRVLNKIDLELNKVKYDSLIKQIDEIPD